MKNIILVGMPGSGKSTLGFSLSHHINFGYFDLDKSIEKKVGKSITDIIEERGEQAFRDLEKKMLNEISGIKSHVISLGGGTLEDLECFELCKAMGTLIWINTPVEELVTRLLINPTAIDARPLLAGLNGGYSPIEKRQELIKRLTTLISVRQKRYEEADYVFSEAYTSIDQTMIMLNKFVDEQNILNP